jgi:hypothetical protein
MKDKAVGLGKRWAGSLVVLDAEVFRVLCVLAGAVGMVAVAVYLPWAEVFLSPPYPSRHRGLGSLFALV